MTGAIRAAAVLGCGLLVMGCVEYRVDPVTGKEYKVEDKGDPQLDAALQQVEDTPDDTRAWYRLGEVYERRGAYLNALAAYLEMQKAIEKREKEEKRKFTGGLFKIGQTLVRLQRYQEAQAYLDKVLALRPKSRRQAVLNLNYRNAHKLLAAIHAHVKNWEQAERHALAFRALGGGGDCDDILSAAARERRPDQVVDAGHEGDGGSTQAAGSKTTQAKPPAKTAPPSDTPRK